jgi:phage recombination protein Bet
MELQNSQRVPSAPVPATGTALFGIDPEKINLIKNTVAENASPDELKLFLYQCSRTGLDPLAKQIYFQKRFNKRRNKFEMTIITGIDGYRLVADRTGQYAGNDDPVFDDEDKPRKATVTVYKIIGQVRCPFTASARWDQYYPGDEQGFMWRKMPHLMLGKCAEALALRKAFPAELSGLYIKEEMDQADQEAPAHDAADAHAVTTLAEKAVVTSVKGRERPSRPARADGPAAAPPVASEADFYTGTEQQRNVLRQAFERHGFDNRDKHAIAAAMKGKPMSALDQIIQDYQRQHKDKAAGGQNIA